MFMAALLSTEIVFIHRKGAKIAKKIFNEVSPPQDRCLLCVLCAFAVN